MISPRRYKPSHKHGSIGKRTNGVGHDGRDDTMNTKEYLKTIVLIVSSWSSSINRHAAHCLYEIGF
jgi:hypothetical protein